VLGLTAALVTLSAVLVMLARGGGDDGFPLAGPPATTATTAGTATTAPEGTAPGGTASPTTTGTPAPGGTGATIGATTATTRAGASTTTPPGGATTTTPPGGSSTTTAHAAGGTVPAGVWGGRGIRLVVTASGGSVEYDCAAGVITTPLTLGAGGTFEASGSHAALSGGPATPGQPVPRSLAARYSGTVNGSQMRLTVSLETGATLGPYTLGLGEAPLLDRCG